MTAREALAQEWRDRLEDFAHSEMTVQQWCDFNALPVHQYYYWRRRLATPKTDHNALPTWMALSVIEPAPLPTAPALTLHIAGAEIQITPGFDPSLLRAVVGALATTAC
jgi:hypothetical protein